MQEPIVTTAGLLLIYLLYVSHVIVKCMLSIQPDWGTMWNLKFSSGMHPHVKPVNRFAVVAANFKPNFDAPKGRTLELTKVGVDLSGKNAMDELDLSSLVLFIFVTSSLSPFFPGCVFIHMSSQIL